MSSDDYFASVAETYDRLQPIIAGPSYDAGRAMVVDLVPHGSHDEFACLDLGCGTGTLIRSVLDRFPEARGIAIDGESAMLEVARRNLSRYAGRVEVRQGDVLGSELPDCDLVLSSFMFHHIPADSLVATLGRVARALRPGGCLILLDQMTAGPAWRERIGAQNRRLSQRHVAAAVAAGRTTREEVGARWDLKRKMKAEGKDVECRHSAESLTAAMLEAGFDEVGLVWRTFANTILMGFVPEGG